MEAICIIIPFYNEADRFPVNEFMEFLQRNQETSFCLVDDGSSDETEIILKSLQAKFPERIFMITLPKNNGKALAIQAGMISALHHFPSGYFGYFDADLSTPLEESFRLRSSLLEKATLEFSFGSRVGILGVRIERKLYRHLIGRVIATFISNILQLMVYDTQCGAKLFTRNLANQVFDKPFITKWLFDVEIFARILGIYGRDRIEAVAVEVPVKSWIDKGRSKVSWLYGFRVFYDLIRIHHHYKAYL
jgi:glycosyltransferase involved in cell wall biosynthesis